MKKRLNSTLKSTAVLSVILMFALGAAWDGSGNASAVTYSASEIIQMGNGTSIDVVNEGEKIIIIWVDSGALDDYMEEQGIGEVNLTVDVIETLIQPPDGLSYYDLEFQFGPSDAFFSRDLEVTLEKDYYNSDVWMYSDDGQPLETYEHGSGDKLYFLVPHFSGYYSIDISQFNYSTSKVIQMSNGTNIDVVNDGEKIVKIEVESGALDAYMEEQDIQEVNLTVGLIETLVQFPDGTNYYELDFEFGPSGAFFSYHLEVTIEHAYYNPEVWMYSENGEALETTKHGNDNQLSFLVPHFSKYSYDHYDY